MNKNYENTRSRDRVGKREGGVKVEERRGERERDRQTDRQTDSESASGGVCLQ